MRLKLTMITAAVGSLLFGLAYLLIPENVTSLYGITLESYEYPRYFGSALIGFASILWLARKTTSGSALRAILIGSFVTSISGLVVAVFQVLNGNGNSFVWSSVLIFFLLSLGFGDFVFRTPPPG